MQAELVAEAATVDYGAYSSSLSNAIDGLLAEAGENPAAISRSFIFNLNSKPDSKHTIYLDFTGHTTSGTYWNSTYTHGASISTPVYSRDSSSAFSNTELRDIYEIWLRVSEDYMPFDVNVTTKEPAKSSLIKSSSSDAYYGVRVCIGGDSSDWYSSAASGVAVYDSFTWSSDTPVFVFAKSLYNLPRYVAESASHEVGHTLGLSHDGKNSAEYYDGANGWAPIMGSAYLPELTQWSKGTYSGANNTEDDIAILGSELGYRADDYAGTASSATKLVFSDSEKLGSGVIGKSSDVDFFWFNLPDDHSVSSITVGGISEVTNLDVIVKLYDSSKNLIKTYDPTGTLYVTMDVSSFAAGKYYMSVAGTGKKVGSTTYYTDYGSLGAYTVSCQRQHVTAAEYASIRAAYPKFGLPAAWDSLNIIEILPDDLSVTNLKKAIATAGKTVGNDLIVVRTTASKHTVSYSSSSSALSIDIAKSSYGSVSIVALGPVPLTINANAKSHAISISGSTVNLGNLTLTNGRAAEGGGIRVSGSSVVQLANCSIVGNTATSYGGGLYALNGTVSLTNCAVTGNNGTNYGGNIYLKYTNTKLTNCTVSGGSAVYGAGVYVFDDTTLNAYNTIIAENDGPNVHKKASATINAYNVLSPFTAWTAGSGNLVYDSSLPLFKDAAHGDYTISSVSQALNKGKTSYATSAGLSASSADLAGNARIISTEIDLGAFENQYALTEPEFTVVSVTKAAVQISIGAVENAASYVVEYGTNTNFANASTVSFSTAGTKWITGLASDTAYYLRVASAASDEKSGYATASAHTETLGTVATPTASVAAKTNTAVQISIGSVDAATAYTLEYSFSDDFVDASSVTYGSAGTRWITGLVSGATYYFRVKATAPGYGDSAYCDAFSNNPNATPISSVTLSTDAPKVGETVTATVAPNGGTATYRWYRGETLISGATSASYVPTADDVGYALTVKAIGVGSSSGSVTATTAASVIVPLTQLDAPTLAILAKTNTGVQISIGAVANATSYVVDYSLSDDFSDATTVTYKNPVTIWIMGLNSGAKYYFRVKASAAAYADSDYSATVSNYEEVATTPLSGVTLSTNAPVGGETVTATVSPSGATASYQWYRGTTAISGATSASYVPTYLDDGYTLKVVATGTGEYSGSVTATTASSVVYPFTQLDVPTLAILAKTSTGVQISIGAVTNATSYVVDYSLSDDFSVATTVTYKNPVTIWITGLNSGAKYYFRVKASAAAYADSEYSATVSNYEEVATTPLSGVTLSTDSPIGGEAVTATVSPSGATATYQWYRGTTAISGATSASYVPTYLDDGYTLKVVATGTGEYSGSVTATTSSSVVYPFTQLDVPTLAILAKTSTGVQISIGAVTNATSYIVDYSLSSDFSDATTVTYKNPVTIWITGLNYGATYYFRVKASAAAYADSEYSATVSNNPNVSPLSGVTLSTDAPKVGQEITAAVSPSGATATYQWYRGETAISGATSASYVPTSDDVGYALTVTATGSGNYSGSVTATAASSVAVPLPQLDAPVASILAKTSTAVRISIGEVLNATTYTVDYALSPDFSNASTSVYGSYGPKWITGLTSGATYYLRVKASGPNYEDSDYCATFTSDDDPITPIEAIALSTDAPKVGLPISVNLLPTNSTADCQWYRGETAIPGATDTTYVPTLDDVGYNLTVTVVGVGGSSGTLSATTALTVVVPPAQLSTPNASVLARTNSAVQVFISTVVNATSYTVDYALTDDFSDAQSKTFSSAGSKWITGLSYGMTYYLRVKATASGFEDSCYSAAFCNFDTPSTPLTGVTLSTTAPKVGQAITATPTPEGAVATYQWYRGTAAIPDATSATYVPTDDDLGLTLTVMAMGTDGYAGSATATASSSVEVAVLKLDAPVLSILAKTNTAVQISIAAVANASTYTVEYSQNSDFSGASTKTYGLSGSKWITGLSSGATYYFRVKASASGYEDSNYSAPVSNDSSLVGSTVILDDGDSLFDDGWDDDFLNALAESFI